MSSINTGANRNEKIVDMCALVQHGCKHPNSLKCRSVQANRSVQSAFTGMSWGTYELALIDRAMDDIQPV